MELRYGGIFDLGSTSGIYQRLAVGDIAVRQPGAALMFGRDASGEVSSDVAVALQNLEQIPDDPDADRKVSLLANAHSQASAEDKAKFDEAAVQAGYSSGGGRTAFQNFLVADDRAEKVDEIIVNLSTRGISIS